MHISGIGGMKFSWMQVLEEDRGRTMGFDMFEKTLDVGMRGLGRISIWSVHTRGVGGIMFLWIRLLKKIPEGLGGLTCWKKHGMWKCEALEELSSVVCTLEVFVEFRIL